MFADDTKLYSPITRPGDNDYLQKNIYKKRVDGQPSGKCPSMLRHAKVCTQEKVNLNECYIKDNEGNIHEIEQVNPSPQDETLDWSKLRAFRNDKVNGTERLKFVMGMVKKIHFGRGQNAGYQHFKGENAAYQHFLLFPQCFQKASFPRSL